MSCAHELWENLSLSASSKSKSAPMHQAPVPAFLLVSDQIWLRRKHTQYGL